MRAQLRGDGVGENFQLAADCARSAVAYAPAFQYDQAEPALLQPVQCGAATAVRAGIGAEPPIVGGSIEPPTFDNFADLAAHGLVSHLSDSRRRRTLQVRTLQRKNSCVLLDFDRDSAPNQRELIKEHFRPENLRPERPLAASPRLRL